MGSATGSILFGTREQVGVGRGLAEFRAGRPVVVTSGSETLLCLPVEGLEQGAARRLPRALRADRAAAGADQPAGALARHRRRRAGGARTDARCRCATRSWRSSPMPRPIMCSCRSRPARRRSRPSNWSSSRRCCRRCWSPKPLRRSQRVQSADHHRRGRRGGALPREGDAIAHHRRRSLCAAELRACARASSCSATPSATTRSR